MAQRILVINSGSSSIKFSVIDMNDEQVVCGGMAEKLGTPDAQLSYSIAGEKKSASISYSLHSAALNAIFSVLTELDLLLTVTAVGHRVVHGGEYFKSSSLINEAVIEAIDKCKAFAPLHNPANLEGIRAAMNVFPNLPQVAVYDTAFHQTMPDTAYRYAVPEMLYTEYGVRRYGFHGTSYRYVCGQAIKQLGLSNRDNALVIAHLGYGCSATAILNGKSMDTTMGFTPLEGLVMGTRSGDIDPGLPSYISNVLKMNILEVENLLNKKSGLLGLSGLSGDMRELQAAADGGHKGAKLAIAVFVFRLAKYIAALMVSLPKLDALVFTGGIGENAFPVRQQTIDRLKVLGFALDDRLNEAARGGKAGIISAEGSYKVLVINTNEELMIAKDTADIVSTS